MSRRRAYSSARGLRTLSLFTQGTYSAPRVAEALMLDARTARGIVQQLTRDGFLEEHPDLPRRYRLAEGAYELGLALVACALRELELREVEHRSGLLAGRALFRFRRSHDISQERFADMLRLNVTDYGLRERGDEEINGAEVVHFADLLGVDVLDLLTLRRGGEGSDIAAARDPRSWR
jgi:hypothetical protein